MILQQSPTHAIQPASERFCSVHVCRRLQKAVFAKLTQRGSYSCNKKRNAKRPTKTDQIQWLQKWGCFPTKRVFLPKEYKLFAEGNPHSYYPLLKRFTQMNRQEPVVIRSASSEKQLYIPDCWLMMSPSLSWMPRKLSLWSCCHWQHCSISMYSQSSKQSSFCTISLCSMTYESWLTDTSCGQLITYIHHNCMMRSKIVCIGVTCTW